MNRRMHPLVAGSIFGIGVTGIGFAMGAAITPDQKIDVEMIDDASAFRTLSGEASSDLLSGDDAKACSDSVRAIIGHHVLMGNCSVGDLPECIADRLDADHCIDECRTNLLQRIESCGNDMISNG